MINRRNFLQISTLAGLSAYGLNTEAGEANNEKAVIYIFLSGGISHFESFNITANAMTRPDVYRPQSDIMSDSQTGITLPTYWNGLYRNRDNISLIQSFGHKDSSHRQSTHYVNTGHYNKNRIVSAEPEVPGHGAVVSNVLGTNNPVNGMPSYIAHSKIEGNQPTFLGSAYKPFDPSNKDNLKLRIEGSRFDSRRDLLSDLDKIEFKNPNIDVLDDYRDQAFQTIQGNVVDYFDIQKESEKTRQRYGSSSFAKQLLVSRRLVEGGAKFITATIGGWDMHSNIKAGMASKVPPVDQAISALIEDLHERGMSKDVMVVVTSEFGRTRFNANQGRDHWGKLTTLMLSGGDYGSGRTVGEMDKYGYVPEGTLYGPMDLQRTIFEHMQIPLDLQRIDNQGRPRYLFDDGGQETRNILA